MIMISTNFFYHAFAVRYTVEFFSLNKYDATKNNLWDGKDGIISKVQNGIITQNGKTIMTICGIMKEVLLAKADQVKSEPNLKDQRKTGRKYIIHMDDQES